MFETIKVEQILEVLKRKTTDEKEIEAEMKGSQEPTISGKSLWLAAHIMEPNVQEISVNRNEGVISRNTDNAKGDPASGIRPAACSTARSATTCVASRRVAAAYGVAHLALRTPFYVQNHDARSASTAVSRPWTRYARGNIGAQG